RSDVVLERMREEGLISPAEEEAAKRSRLRITSSPGLADAHSGYAKEYLRQLFREQVGSDDPPDWEVHTTLLPAVQASAERALAESNNQAAVALQMRVGTGPILSLASDLGLHDMPDVPSLALGTGSATPLELTVAYAAFPNGGFAVAPRAIARILDADGSVAVENKVRKRRALSPEAAFQVVSMLREVVDAGTGTAARSLGVRGPV